MKKQIRIILIILLFLILVLVRGVIEPHFYDPLIPYFKNEYLYSSIPDLKIGKYFLNIFYRYAINSIISLAIIHLFFMNMKTLKFSIKIYLLAFLILCLGLFVLLKYNLIDGYLLIFYVRRFLIQPLLLLILLPAFYFQKLKIIRVN